MKQTVQVLMSTYNGEKYVAEQIDSILEQEDVNIRLLVRDDGSKDATMKILEQYENKHSNIKIYTGKNLGASNSFFNLLKNADQDVSYYAFADQDDVWKKDKIKRALSRMNGNQNVPILYCGAYELVGSKLEKIEMKQNNDRNISFGNALIECNCTGCTSVFNKRLLELVLKKIPQHAYMHDWWLYLTACSMGQVIFDKEAYILYRQHEKNVLGGNNGAWKQVQRRIKNYKNLCDYVPRQIEEFYSIYKDNLSEEQKLLIKCMLNENKSPWKRLEIFKRKEIKRNNGLDNIIYKFMFLFWRI